MKGFRRVKLTVVLMLGMLFVPAAAYSVELRTMALAERAETPETVEYVSGEVLVKLRDGVLQGSMAGPCAEVGAAVLSHHARGVKRVKVPEGKTEHELIAELVRDPRIQYAILNTVCHAHLTPNDTFYNPYQWNFPRINCPEAWDISTGTSVLVCILDTGIAYENYGIPAHELEAVTAGATTYQRAPDFSHTNFAPGYDFINNDDHPNDNNSHGTHVAGTVAETTDNAYGVAGIAFDCTLMPVKVLAFSGEGTAQSVADGIYWAADNGAQVINMSLGWPSGYDPGPVVHDAIEYAYEQGAVLVASSGNGGSSPVAYPAAYPEVIAVGATRYDDGRVIYSQYGSALEVVAPGGDVFADQNGDSYPDGIVQNTFAGYYPGRLANPNDFAFYCYEGTSMAAPHVSGLVAMMIANGQTGIENIRNILHETAIDLGEPGWDPYYGYGRIDALGALTHTDTSLTARFTGDPVEGSAPLAVDFADHSTGTVTSWEWDFGDGSAYSSEQHASHEYADPGEYTVTLTVYGPAGSDSEIKTDYIQVDGDLIAAFSATPTQGYAPLGVSFSDESVGEVTSWEWDFGDGSPHSSEERPSHQYAAAGSYTVTLTVVGPEGTDSEAKADYIRVTAPGLAIIGEVGSVIQDQPGANTWHTVSLRNAYTSPVVIAKSLSSNSSEPAHVRIRQVTSSSFQWQIEEWEYQDGSHSSETMNYVVVEAGSHRLEDGTRLAAGVEAVDDSWAMVSFDRVFGSRPALLVSTMTTGDPCACVPRTQGLERDRFEIRVQEEEAQDQAHGTEIVGWLAVEPRTGANNGNKYHAGRTGNVVKHGGYTLSLTGFSSPPIFLCHDDTYNGANVCAVRWRNLTAASVEVVAEEETSYDPEINHTGEAVSFLAWAAPGDLVSDGEWTERNLDCRSHRSVDDGPSDMCVRPPVLTCSPNPFTQSTTLSISVAAATSVETVVYDTCGRRVRALAHGRLPSGTHMLAWDGTDEAGKRVTSGVYFFKVVTGSEIVTRKVIMLR